MDHDGTFKTIGNHRDAAFEEIFILCTTLESARTIQVHFREYQKELKAEAINHLKMVAGEFAVDPHVKEWIEELATKKIHLRKNTSHP